VARRCYRHPPRRSSTSYWVLTRPTRSTVPSHVAGALPVEGVSCAWTPLTRAPRRRTPLCFTSQCAGLLVIAPNISSGGAVAAM
jgi:hypothetical protein